ncbi:MAG: hydroxyisourate hydrolase [Gemmatimonadetes bacterium]|nr:hydroxyisourate hydrolase [Gemmatimonadota bacterium]
MSSISTHVLDTARGRPAAGIEVRLAVRARDGWTELATARTDADGRVTNLMPATAPPATGTFRLRFEVAAYFAAQGITGFYPYVEVVFEARDDGRYHVPLLLSPYGYSTYRGS